MNIISPKVHAFFDYVLAILLLTLPWTLGFNDDLLGTAMFVMTGIVIFTYSILTQYELGILPELPFTCHLLLDFLTGSLLISSPWVLGFSEFVFLPHVLLGFAAVALSLITTVPPELPAVSEHQHHSFERQR